MLKLRMSLVLWANQYVEFVDVLSAGVISSAAYASDIRAAGRIVDSNSKLLRCRQPILRIARAGCRTLVTRRRNDGWPLRGCLGLG